MFIDLAPLYIKLDTGIHVFSRYSALGKTYLSYYINLCGVTDILVRHVFSKQDLKGVFDAADENTLIIIDRLDLYLTEEVELELFQHTNLHILLDLKDTFKLARANRKLTKSVYIKREPGRIMITDDDIGRQWEDVYQHINI